MIFGALACTACYYDCVIVEALATERLLDLLYLVGKHAEIGCDRTRGADKAFQHRGVCVVYLSLFEGIAGTNDLVASRDNRHLERRVTGKLREPRGSRGGHLLRP